MTSMRHHPRKEHVTFFAEIGLYGDGQWGLSLTRSDRAVASSIRRIIPYDRAAISAAIGIVKTHAQTIRIDAWSSKNSLFESGMFNEGSFGKVDSQFADVFYIVADPLKVLCNKEQLGGT